MLVVSSQSVCTVSFTPVEDNESDNESDNETDNVEVLLFHCPMSTHAQLQCQSHQICY